MISFLLFRNKFSKNDPEQTKERIARINRMGRIALTVVKEATVHKDCGYKSRINRERIFPAAKRIKTNALKVKACFLAFLSIVIPL